MNLLLSQGYPFPMPEDLTDEQQDEISADAGDTNLVIEGVVHFEWLHTVTVEFKSRAHQDAAQALTGWEPWGDNCYPILQASTSTLDGYDHPAIIAGREGQEKAYCGILLRED